MASPALSKLAVGYRPDPTPRRQQPQPRPKQVEHHSHHDEPHRGHDLAERPAAPAADHQLDQCVLRPDGEQSVVRRPERGQSDILGSLARERLLDAIPERLRIWRGVG